MEQEQIQSVAFEIILHSGSSRTMIHEAFKMMKNNEFKDAADKLEEANNELLLAHKSQTALLQQYSSGETINMEIIMVHAQDHLMTTMTLKEVASEMLYLYEKLENDK
ncbi:PTS cellobiose transporter subunit IIA [Heyndrickxia sporothermodurans]|uniref:PTS cellobiose transporter subunit IIA n=1 Tax=Heyndrickxia sporothermodurans TaxID=46224 RepID=UPI000D35EC64|nr:PTS cellobiose transporter subunit IIA [Heyndrickxia sporothermodurans]MBL5766404.1 PTS cellobiose transporter subunit IIA [Heyndrickxia sporothermodurans]MBL5769843.1 PTS cellobiose transporter subunit IIA [Heyndrickxia sporothermodurans]MBL5776922.1 PTS cellobiose transporter subunit IIA [Heyndrickxia sporothermodurans]MBL5782289.1 PTS cellobiose transporter subunit IIA [Heyndrickxia sporothermodurans]MBL5784212.1 PTS cellobiose transporter subunit IIA [Heyndrickxia sporothermodurans]